jgi:DNA polymerase III delta subunit
MIYVLVGEDTLAKDDKMNKLKAEFLPRHLEEFSLDTLYGKELSLAGLQERILCLPVNDGKRVVVIKDAEELKNDIKEFLVLYAKKPQPGVVLIIDIVSYRSSAAFIKNISSHAQVCRFKEQEASDTFTLCRQLDSRKASASLKILQQLLKNGERPERILGGLRSSWMRNSSSPAELKKKLKLLLTCDLDIKTGRLKPAFALERLIIKLCGPQNTFS